AVEHGLKYGAMGVLNTDWGDRGHWQHLPRSYAVFAYGAAMSWHAGGNRDGDLASGLDAHVFADKAGVLGKLALDLGNAYQQPGITPSNSSILNSFYVTSLERMRERRKPDAPGGDVLHNNSLLLENLYGTIEYIDDVMARMDDAQSE